MRTLWLMAAAALMACSDKKAGDSGEGEVLSSDGGDGTEDTCSTTPPVIDSVTCTGAYGPVGDGEGAILVFSLEGSDEDGDLDSYVLSLYLDESLDGVVEPVDSPYGPSTGSTSGAECATYAVLLDLNAGVPGTYPSNDTRYEWGLVLSDASGMESEMYTIACTTPASDGSGDIDPEPT